MVLNVSTQFMGRIAFEQPEPGLKTGVENDIFFWSEMGSGLGELGGTPPPRIPGSIPFPPPPPPPSSCLKTRDM